MFHGVLGPIMFINVRFIYFSCLSSYCLQWSVQTNTMSCEHLCIYMMQINVCIGIWTPQTYIDRKSKLPALKLLV